MKKFKGIRCGFRPKSYWNESDPLEAILRNIKGENRRRMVIDYWNAGHLEKLDATLLNDELDEEDRRGLGRIHPSFMGGEYLPGYLPGEVEIARISLQSTTSDVISLRARPTPSGIAYRIENTRGNSRSPSRSPGFRSLLPSWCASSTRALSRACQAISPRATTT